ncbi:MULTISPECIES: glutamate racemase [Enterococcus]|uniref:Glutamate racemase n=1 Tax=Enterococcus mundtii TaxID=53346 RepID=A0A1V2UAQ7_ENTMU|nr:MULTISPECIES: glutamate racemase [Enterococcus]ONN40357.1 glutamate racemase [Enterococcus mundtii]
MIRLTDKRPIGFIDSGVGGLTVVKEALKQLPNENILYVGDTARCPYGPRPAEQVIAYTWEMTNYLVEKGIKMLVIACNTATAVALEEIKATLSIPVIGVILPGTRAAVKQTKNHRVGVIGTIGTVKSAAYETSLLDKAPELKVTSLACPKFVSVVESKEYRSSVAKKIVAQTLAPLELKGIDTLILGCTHYPLLRPIIQNVMGDKVMLIDSGAETIGEVSMLLDYFEISNSPQNGRTLCQFYTTGSAKMFHEIAQDWLGLKELIVESIDLGGKEQ